jgi:hypothetical protein
MRTLREFLENMVKSMMLRSLKTLIQTCLKVLLMCYMKESLMLKKLSKV